MAPTPVIPPPDSGTPQDWITIGISIATGMLSAVGSVLYWGGGMRATIDAHDKRIKTLEDETRYEVRALRDTMSREMSLMRDAMHDLRNEVVMMIGTIQKRDGR